jgi:hypothetical protein
METKDSNTNITNDTTTISDITNTITKRPFYLSFKFIAVIIITLALFIFIIWLYFVLQTNANAEKYKTAYDVAIKQLKYCDSIKSTTQTREVFYYCDQLEEKFKDVER